MRVSKRNSGVYRRRAFGVLLFASVLGLRCGETEVFMLSVRHLSIQHRQDLRPLVDDLSFTVSGQDRLAIIGEEGNGKSTVLKILYQPTLVEDYVLFSGQVDRSGERLAYLPQELPEACRELPVYAFCAQCEAFLEALPREVHTLCAQLRLPVELCYAECPMKSLSGGEKIKLQLLLLLCAHPSLLLLDEPSNDLDLSALDFLERFISTCGLPVIYISHDETLLSRTATRVLHLELTHHKKEPRWTLANVPYDEYMSRRAQQLSLQESRAQMEKRQERIRQEKFERILNAVDHAQATISRGDPHGARLLKKKMHAVKSLERRYERERENQTQRPNIEYAIDASFVGSHALPAGKVALDISLPALCVEGRTLSRNISLRMQGTDKVLLIGDNGCGKTTLLRRLAQNLLARDDIRAAYMPQRYEETMDEDQSAIAYLHTRGDKEQLTRLRTYLGAFKFSTEEMEHPIRSLSGGQKAKLFFLRMILEDANVLLLDEPTRNLSPLSAPVIRALLLDFPGAILAVTHDRLLMQQWPGRVLRLTKNGLSDVTAAVKSQSGAVGA